MQTALQTPRFSPARQVEDIAKEVAAIRGPKAKVSSKTADLAPLMHPSQHLNSSICLEIAGA